MPRFGSGWLWERWRVLGCFERDLRGKADRTCYKKHEQEGLVKENSQLLGWIMDGGEESH